MSDGDLLNALLLEFGELFMEPCGMPLKHHYDHQIHLVVGMDVVAVRPYR